MKPRLVSLAMLFVFVIFVTGCAERETPADVQKQASANPTAEQEQQPISKETPQSDDDLSEISELDEDDDSLDPALEDIGI